MSASKSASGRSLVHRGVLSTGVVLVSFVVVSFGLNAAVRLSCYDVCGSDVGRLYEDRGIDRDHPPLIDRNLEYPPVIAGVMYAASLPFERGLRGPFLLNALVLTALAALTTWMLWRRFGLRTRRWALSPPLLLQGLTNWDMLAVAPRRSACSSGKPATRCFAGVLLGVGTAAKVFPRSASRSSSRVARPGADGGTPCAWWAGSCSVSPP